MRLDRILAERKMKSNELAATIGTSVVNLSNIKTGKIRGIRFSTLEALCEALECKPGDLIDYVTQEEYDAMMARRKPRQRKTAATQPVAQNVAAAEDANQPTGTPSTSLQALSDLALQVLPSAGLTGAV